jgi:CelD/BcsL family acetyltransferase involved in cellulose biosynthesis
VRAASNTLAKLGNIFRRLQGATGLTRPDDAPFEPFEAQGLIVCCHTSWPSEAGLLRTWEELLTLAPDATAFQSPTWQRAAWQTTGNGAGLRLITVHRGEALAAVAPMSLNAAGGVVSIGAGVSDYLEPVAQPLATCVQAMLTFVASQWDRRLVEVTFHNVREASAFRATLAALAEPAGFALEQKIVEHAPVIELPASWEAYLASLDPHERKELRRKLNKAETKGAAEWVRAAEDALDRALALMQATGGDKAAAIQNYVRPLLLAVGPAMIGSRQLELWELKILGVPACALLQFRHRDGPMLYNIGHDPAMKAWSPGVVAVAMAIRDAIASGSKNYDLLRGREAYKYKLGGVDRPLFKLTLKRSPRG